MVIINFDEEICPQNFSDIHTEHWRRRRRKRPFRTPLECALKKARSANDIELARFPNNVSFPDLLRRTKSFIQTSYNRLSHIVDLNRYFSGRGEICSNCQRLLDEQRCETTISDAKNGKCNNKTKDEAAKQVCFSQTFVNKVQSQQDPRIMAYNYCQCNGYRDIPSDEYLTLPVGCCCRCLRQNGNKPKKQQKSDGGWWFWGGKKKQACMCNPPPGYTPENHICMCDNPSMMQKVMCFLGKKPNNHELRNVWDPTYGNGYVDDISLESEPNFYGRYRNMNACNAYPMNNIRKPYKPKGCPYMNNGPPRNENSRPCYCDNGVGNNSYGRRRQADRRDRRDRRTINRCQQESDSDPKEMRSLSRERFKNYTDYRRRAKSASNDDGCCDCDDDECNDCCCCCPCRKDLTQTDMQTEVFPKEHKTSVTQTDSPKFKKRRCCRCCRRGCKACRNAKQNQSQKTIICKAACTQHSPMNTVPHSPIKKYSKDDPIPNLSMQSFKQNPDVRFATIPNPFYFDKYFNTPFHSNTYGMSHMPPVFAAANFPQKFLSPDEEHKMEDNCISLSEMVIPTGSSKKRFLNAVCDTILEDLSQKKSDSLRNLVNSNDSGFPDTSRIKKPSLFNFKRASKTKLPISTTGKETPMNKHEDSYLINKASKVVRGFLSEYSKNDEVKSPLLTACGTDIFPRSSLQNMLHRMQTMPAAQSKSESNLRGRGLSDMWPTTPRNCCDPSLLGCDDSYTSILKAFSTLTKSRKGNT